jgi:hypothetical protein
LTQPAVRIPFPARPILAECPQKPIIEGHLIGNGVVLTLEQALELRNWIVATLICYETNQVLLEGYIEKIENRLKALGQ